VPLPKVEFRGLMKLHGPLVAVFMTALKGGSWPIGSVVSKATTDKAIWRVDAFQIGFFALPLLMLGLAPIDSILYLLWPLLRLPDLEFIYARSFVYNIPPASKARAVLHLFLHYTEVILLFALLYLFMQTHAPGREALFLKNGVSLEHLTAAQAVFFSFTTCATIGYGDITPNHSAAERWVIVVYVLIWLKTLMIFTFTLVELARVVGFSNEPTAREKDVPRLIP
jgi:hypothetical protein